MNDFNAQVKAIMPINSRHVLAFVIALLGVAPISPNAQAMSFDQMKMLAGTALLDARVDTVLNDCGLPSAIADTAPVTTQRKTIRWADVVMKLSSMNWDIVYSRQQKTADHGNGWVNPGPASGTCLSNLSGLVLHSKGDAGILTVNKRADNNGYLTTYHVPDDLYAAHQVIGLTASWKQGVPISKIEERYGRPDEIQHGEDGLKLYRYWVVVKHKQMPVSLHAVDFDVRGEENFCTHYTVRTNGFEFVQEKLDALQRQWERDYVLD